MITVTGTVDVNLLASIASIARCGLLSQISRVAWSVSVCLSMG